MSTNASAAKVKEKSKASKPTLKTSQFSLDSKSKKKKAASSNTPSKSPSEHSITGFQEPLAVGKENVAFLEAHEAELGAAGSVDTKANQAACFPARNLSLKEGANADIWFAAQHSDEGRPDDQKQGPCSWQICSTAPFKMLRNFLKSFFPYWDVKAKAIKAPYMWDLKFIVIGLVAQVYAVLAVPIHDAVWYNSFFAVGFAQNVQLLAFGLPDWHFWFKENIADQHAISVYERIAHVLVPAAMYLLWFFYPLVDNGAEGYDQCKDTPLGETEDNSKLLYYVGVVFCPLISSLSVLTSVKGNSSTAYSASCIRCIFAISFNAAGMLGIFTLHFCRSPQKNEMEDALDGYLTGLFSSWAVLFVYTTTLVFRRVAALALTTGDDSSMPHMTLFFYIASVSLIIGMGFVSMTAGMVGSVRKALSALMVVAGLVAFAAFGYKVVIFFRKPVEILFDEVQKTQGAPRAEAQWAATVMLWEYRAAKATMGTSFIYGCVLLGALFGEERDDGWLLPFTYVVDALTNTIAIMALSGVLQNSEPQGDDSGNAATVQRVPKMKMANEFSEFDENPEWKAKVYDLAGRGFTLERLLDFYCSLGKDIMKHYNLDIHTTNDVARQAIIPSSVTDDGGGKALASVWNAGEFTPPDRFVTHHWDNVFSHLVAAIVADGLDLPCFDQVIVDVKESRMAELKQQLQMKGTLHRRYWVCAFCINQHACICSGFGPPPPEGTPTYKAYQRKRVDTVTKKVFDLCTCNQTKYFSDSPIECEVNKFDALMAFLLDQHEHHGGQFSQMIACDTRFDLFNRAWCVAELVEADSSDISQYMRIFSKKSLDKNYKKLASLDVQQCEASRIEDKDAILAKIENCEAFNERLQWLIFGQGGLLSSWMDGQSKVAGAGRVLQRVLRRASVRNSVSSVLPKTE